MIERIVGTWGDALLRSNAGIDADQLRAMLEAMRADQLLGASLAGSLAVIRYFGNTVAGISNVAKCATPHARRRDPVASTPRTPVGRADRSR